MRLAALAVLLALAACTRSPVTSAPASSLVTTTSTAPSEAVETTLPQPGCIQGEPPLQEGSGELPITLQEGEPDARHISGWSVTSEKGCDRLTVSLATEGGAPARLAGEVHAFLLLEQGVLRIVLDPAITSSAVVDHRFEGDFVWGTFAVRSLEGPVFLDVHLAAPTSARVFVDRSPAVITVDLAGGEQPIGLPGVGDQAVIIEPSDRSETYPLEVAGYARSPTVSARIAGDDSESDVVATESAEGGDIWREFQLVIPTGPVGTVDLEVNGSTASVSKLLEIS